MQNNEEFCEKIRLYEDPMYAVAFSILKNEHDAADAISDAIVKAYCNLSQLKNDRSFKSWILKIVHNTSLEMLRKRCVTVDIEDQYDLADESASQDSSTKLTLRDAVEGLKQPYRTVIILYYYDGLSVMEISKITEASAVAVKKQLSRAREMLREVLNEEDFF